MVMLGTKWLASNAISVSAFDGWKVGARAQGKALPVHHIYREVREHVNIENLCVSRSFGSQQVLWAQQTMKDGGEEGEAHPCAATPHRRGSCACTRR